VRQFIDQICLTWREKSSDHRPALLHTAGFSARRQEDPTSALWTIANASLASHSWSLNAFDYHHNNVLLTAHGKRRLAAVTMLQ
jgi:hypothetical protein